ncbi:MAG: response regulator transcription factor [Lachnospiraceae bacterium]
MLKLLIVDDEEIICNTIATSIDWHSLGIKLIGTCLDGVDAYHTILDESPEIVMTDIRMPGISGLELIERINSRGAYTQFVILSGYGEFDYAKRAMKCGVRHYLLKPCDEYQIIDCIKEVVDECNKISPASTQTAPSDLMAEHMQHAFILNIIREGLALPELDNDFFSAYHHYFSLTDMPFHYCCFYYLEESNVDDAIAQIRIFLATTIPMSRIHMVYVRNVLLLFFPNYNLNYQQMDNFFKTLSFPEQTTAIVYERISYSNLESLLELLIPKLKRYDLVYFSDGRHMLPYFNYGHIQTRINQLIPHLLSSDTGSKQSALMELSEILRAVTSIDFLIQLSDNLIISIVTKTTYHTLADITEFLYKLHKETSLSAVCEFALQKVTELLTVPTAVTQYSPFINKLITYLTEHLSDPNLSLKWIAENHLYMNVNYVSRCFLKETGQKFSGFLMNLRVEKAKEILAVQDNEKIQNIAELVGCGNNPYYFSKIFKKCTGMTPSAYVRKLSKQQG